MTLELRVIEGPARGQRFLFRSPVVVTIGRGPECEVTIDDPKISRRHCEIAVVSDGCLVRDLGSANGTRVNGVPVDSGALEDGDRLRLGESAIECAIRREEAEPDDEAGAGAIARSTGLPAGYRFLGQIGSGSYGAVYKAEQLALGRLVAIKVLRVAASANPREVARFIRGARAEAQLTHPNIVQVFDFIRARDVHVVMEYVDGEDLRKRTARLGRLEVREAVRCTLQLLAALEHAYERRIVHRDVKPENVIVRADGVAKLTDFGLARNFGEAGLSGITNPDEGAGTPAYMAPEQLRSARTVDQRADVYSAGATLYHVLAGVPPFLGSVADVIRLVLREPPPPIETLVAGIPPGLAAAIGRSLAKEPALRPATPAAFAAEIARFA